MKKILSWCGSHTELLCAFFLMGCCLSSAVKDGYHMYKVYEYGSWMGYACDKKPFREGASEVLTFNDFID